MLICTKFTVGNLISSLGSGSLMNLREMKGFLFKNSALFWRRKCTLKFISQHCKNTAIHPPNQPDFVNKGDSEVIHVLVNDPQHMPVLPLKWWSFYFVAKLLEHHQIYTEVRLNTTHRSAESKTCRITVDVHVTYRQHTQLCVRFSLTFSAAFYPLIHWRYSI